MHLIVLLEVAHVNSLANKIFLWFPDGSSSCYVAQLEKHLAKCNSRPKPLPEYICRNLNVADQEEREEIKISLSSLSDDELLKTIDMVSKIHAGNVYFYL